MVLHLPRPAHLPRSAGLCRVIWAPVHVRQGLCTRPPLWRLWAALPSPLWPWRLELFVRLDGAWHPSTRGITAIVIGDRADGRDWCECRLSGEDRGAGATQLRSSSAWLVMVRLSLSCALSVVRPAAPESLARLVLLLELVTRIYVRRSGSHGRAAMSLSHTTAGLFSTFAAIDK